MAKASYRAELLEHCDPFGTRTGRTLLIITDLNKPGARSVTNDIENVLAECLQTYGRNLPARIIYRDSEGVWDGIKHNQGTFRGFKPLCEKRLTQAIACAFALDGDNIPPSAD